MSYHSEAHERQENGSLDITGKIIDFESGMLGAEETLELFQELVNTGLAWQLQGSYGRTADSLISSGLIHPPVQKSL